MQSIELIRDNLKKSSDRVLARVEEMREHFTVFPTPNRGAHECGCSGALQDRAHERSGPRNHEMKVKPWCRKCFRICNSSQEEYFITYFHGRRDEGAGTSPAHGR